MSKSFKFDVFLSHASADKSDVRELAERLRADGLSVWFDEWVIIPGDSISLAIEQGLECSRTLVLVMSRSAFNSEWVTLERHTAHFRDPTNRQRRFIPLRLDDCDIPIAIKNFAYVDWTLKTDAQYDRLVAACGASSVAKFPLERSEVAGTRGSHSDDDSCTFATSIQEHTKLLKNRITTLTTDQIRVITLLRGNRRVRIAGCAGSGKTLVAAEKSIRLAQAGLSTLCVCHSPLLAEYLRRLTHGSGVEVIAFNQWVASYASRGEGAVEDNWTHFHEPSQVQVNRAFEVVATSGPYYDAIIVDEGQDFREDWWLLIESALRDSRNGILYIFHDDHQALFPFRASYPTCESVINLSRNCRNAGAVYQLIEAVHPDAPPPEESLSRLGQSKVINYDVSGFRGTLEEAVKWLADRTASSFVTLINSSNIESQLVGTGVCTSEPSLWQEAVKESFIRAIHRYDTRGVMIPAAGKEEVLSLFQELSPSPKPTREDVDLVRSIANLFTVDGVVRRRIESDQRFHRAMHWKYVGGKLRLIRRSKQCPIWSSEVVLHFERDDWHVGLPEPRIVQFELWRNSVGENIIPVHYIGNFKGLEAESVLLILDGTSSRIEFETYVGISRATSAIALLIESRTAHALPTMISNLSKAKILTMHRS